jgi:O-antigen ligase
MGFYLLYRAEGFLLVLAVFPWLDFAARRALGPGLGGAWDEALLLVLFVGVLFGAVVLRRFELTTVPLTLPLGIAFVAAVGSVLLNDVPFETGIFALRVTFEPVLFFYAAYLLPKNARWVRYAVCVFLATSVVLALHGLFQYVTGAPMPKAWVDAQEQAIIGTRAYSIVENPNGLGAFLLMGALLAGSLMFARLRAATRVLMFLVFVVLVAGIVVTFSRGAWLGLVVGAVALAALAHRRLLAWFVGVGVVSPLVFPEAVLTRISFGFSGAYLAKSLTAGRLFMWQAALYRAFENPLFGLGLGTFGGTSAFLFGYSRLWVDNFYLQMAAEGGLILLSAFIWMLWRAGKGMVAAYVDGRDPGTKAVAAGIFGGFVAVCVANVTASVWETLVVGQAFWFLAGMAASMADGGRPPAARLPDMGELWPGPEGRRRRPRAVGPGKTEKPDKVKKPGKPVRPAPKKDKLRSAGRGNRQQRRAASKKTGH